MSKLLKYYGVQCYNSFDEILAVNFTNIISKGELKHLLIGRVKLGNEINTILSRRWNKIYNGYINHFGFSERYLKVLQLKKQIALLQIKMMETGDGFIETHILIKRKKLAEIEARSEEKNMDFYEIKTHLENHFKFRIDPKTTTAIEFYTMVNELKTKK